MSTSAPPRHRTPWTLKEVKRANELISQGHSRKEVAAILGRTVFGVRTHLPRKRRPTRPKFEVLKEFVEDELSTRHMANLLKVNRSTVQKWLKQYNLLTRKPGRNLDPFIRTHILDLIAKGYDSCHSLTLQLQRNRSTVWYFLRQLMLDNIIVKTGNGHNTRYKLSRTWITARRE